MTRRYQPPTPAWFAQSGFGLAVPTPIPGNPGHVADVQPHGYNYCGSKHGMQQMLQDLGYYSGPIDGKIGTSTIIAMKAFGVDHGVPIAGNTLDDEWCQRLMDVWQQKVQSQVVVPAHHEEPLPVEPVPSEPASNGPVPNGSLPVPAPGNGNGTTVPAPQGPIDKAKDWWNRQTTGVKVAMGIGGVAIVGLIVYALVGKKKTYTANLRPTGRYKKAQQVALGKVRGKRRRAKTGKITTLKSGKRYGHLKPPKRYYQRGAKRPSDYADPEHYKYPLVFRDSTGKVKSKETKKHIRAAQSYFARHKTKYPMATRRKIARSINRAKKHYGVGGKVVKP